MILQHSFNKMHIKKQSFFKKVVLRNFKKFIGKHLCQSLFFNKVAGLRPVTVTTSKESNLSLSQEQTSTNLNKTQK